MSRNFKSRSKLKGLELQCLKMKERTSVGLQRNIIANKTNKIEIANNNFYTEKHGNVAIIGQLNHLY